MYDRDLHDWNGGKLFASLVGETITEIRGLTQYSDEVFFKTASGRTFKMYHEQSCCESVSLEDFEFDAVLLGHPITLAEVSTSDSAPDASPREYTPDSQTYTFYRLASLGGSLYLRWYGSSNGYYSESVSFVEMS